MLSASLLGWDVALLSLELLVLRPSDLPWNLQQRLSSPQAFKFHHRLSWVPSFQMADGGTSQLHNHLSQYFILNLFLERDIHMSYWFCFCGEP